MYKEILTSSGCAVLVDDEDYENLKKYYWSLSTKGYVQRRIKKNGKWTTSRIHREIMNAPSDKQVDHINGDKLDNRKANLRLCTNSQNARNRHKSLGKSKYKGVSWCNTRNIWVATIYIDGKNKTLGRFKSEETAANIYNKAAKEHFGEFAWLNNV